MTEKEKLLYEMMAILEESTSEIILLVRGIALGMNIECECKTK